MIKVRAFGGPEHNNFIEIHTRYCEMTRENVPCDEKYKFSENPVTVCDATGLSIDYSTVKEHVYYAVPILGPYCTRHWLLVHTDYNINDALRSLLQDVTKVI